VSLTNFNPGSFNAEASPPPPKPTSTRIFSIDDFKTNNAANNASPTFVQSANLNLADQTFKNARDEDSPMPSPTREEMDAKIAASEARGRTDIVRFEGKLETLAATLSGKMDAVQTSIRDADAYNRGTRSVIIASMFALAGLIVAIAALLVGMITYGDALFGRGMNVRDVVQAIAREQQDPQKRESSVPAALPAPSTSSKVPEK
jgi:hypothetical protein